MEFRSATGCGINESKEYLRTWDRVLVEKVIEAARVNGRLPELGAFAEQSKEIQNKILMATKLPSDFAWLVDPIENDPVRGPLVKVVLQEEEARIRTENNDEWPMGSFHLIWKRVKKRLLAEHGIDWHSPRDLNPSATFD